MKDIVKHWTRIEPTVLVNALTQTSQKGQENQKYITK